MNKILEKLNNIKRNMVVGIIFLIMGLFLIPYGVKYFGSMCILFIVLGHISWSALLYGLFLLICNILILSYAMLKIFGSNN